VAPGPRHTGPWATVETPHVTRWLRTLNEKDRAHVDAAIKQLRQDGPTLDSTRAKLIKSSRHRNMKELLSVGGHIRVLFAFDRRQRAVLLVGGDKSGDWERWYKRNVPLADTSYDDHQRSLAKEAAWAPTGTRSKERSAGAGR
jgi:hypothetical protein